MNTQNIKELNNYLKKNDLMVPSHHITLGSGISNHINGNIDNQWDQVGELKFSELNDFPVSKVSGHNNSFLFFNHKEKEKTIVLQCGRVHGYEGFTPKQVYWPQLLYKLIGCDNFTITNAAGSLRKKWKPGSIMMITDHVNFTGENPLKGENTIYLEHEIGPRFPDMSNVYLSSEYEKLQNLFSKNSLDLYSGVYTGLSGPSYETPAEINIYQKLGLDAVGMSTVWEAIGLKHAGAKIHGFSLLTNFASGITALPLSHSEVTDVANKSGGQMIKTIVDYIGDLI